MILKDTNRYFNKKTNFFINEYVKEIVNFII